LESLVRESAGTSPAVGEPEGVARMLFADLDVSILWVGEFSDPVRPPPGTPVA